MLILILQGRGGAAQGESGGPRPGQGSSSPLLANLRVRTVQKHAKAGGQAARSYSQYHGLAS